MNKSPSTFSHTELLISEEERQEEDYRLPSSINVISIREAFISDAPFISRANSGNFTLLDSIRAVMMHDTLLILTSYV